MYITLTALLEARNNWNVNIDEVLLNGLILFDLKKAFNTIDYEVVIRKFVKYTLNQNSVGWFTSYLFSSSQQWLYLNR